MAIDLTPRPASGALTKTGGFLAGFTHTLQPYIGCRFSCEYCYVKGLGVHRFHQPPLEWGAISQYYDFGGAIQQAIEAGVDIISISNNSGYQAGVATRASSVIRDLVDKGTISAERIDQSYQRIMRLKERLPVAA